MIIFLILEIYFFRNIFFSIVILFHSINCIIFLINFHLFVCHSQIIS